VAESAGALRIDLSANSAQFDRDLGMARLSLARTGEGFNKIQGIAGKAGEELSRGLKRGVNDFRELGDAMGLVGGKFGKLGAVIAEFALGGFSPVSLAVAGLGFAFGALMDKGEETFKKKLPEAILETKRAADDAFASLVKLDRQLHSEKTGEDPRVVALREAIRQQSRFETGLFPGVNKQDELDKLAAMRAELALLEQSIAEKKQAALVTKNEGIMAQQNADRAAKAAAKAKAAEQERIDALSAEVTIHDQFVASLVADAKASAAGAKARKDAVAAGTEELERQAVIQDKLRRMSLDAEGEFGGGYRLKPVEVPPETVQSIRDFNSEITRMKEELKGVDEVGVAVANTLTHGVASGAADALVAIADGSKSAKEAFSQFAKSVVTDLTRMILEAVIFRAIMSSIGLSGAPATGGAAVAGAAGGGAKSLAVSGAATKSAMKVELHNYGGAKVSTAEDIGPDGAKRLRVMIEDAAAESISKGGKVWQAIRDTTGASRVPKRR
jgi:hypothetical protein